MMFGLFNNRASESCKQLIEKGAEIIDVRSPGEFQGGHVKGSKNIPLDRINKEIDALKSIGKPLILCCASGGRSGAAESVLKKHGIECCNGGSWNNVNALVA